MKKLNYNTKQKMAINEQIKALGDKHFTIDSLCEAMVNNGEAVGRTTVYRLVEKLSQEGILRKFIMPKGDSVCYQYVGQQNHCNEHFHLKCEKCGKLIHIECDEMNQLADHIVKHHGFLLNPLKTVIYGICEVCNSK